MRVAIVMDFETTGLEVEEGAEPIELAAIAVDLDDPDIQELSRFPARLMRVKNPEKANPRALEVNKKTIEQIMAAESPEAVFQDFAKWAEQFTPLEDRALPAYKRRRPMFMCHNAKFDIAFMKWAFRQYVPNGMSRYDELFHYHTRDTFEIASFWINDIVHLDNSCSLEKLTKYYKIPHDAHNAMSDVEACLAVYKHLYKEVRLVMNDATLYALQMNEDTL